MKNSLLEPPSAYNPTACYCDNGHEQANSVCMNCWNKAVKAINGESPVAHKLAAANHVDFYDVKQQTWFIVAVAKLLED